MRIDIKSTSLSSGMAQSLASRLIREAQQRSGLSLREIGRRAGTSHATLSAYLNMRKSPATSTLVRILEACDVALDVSLQPRIRERRGLPRGEELAQVLRLAEQFPSKPSRNPGFPVFPG